MYGRSFERERFSKIVCSSVLCYIYIYVYVSIYLYMYVCMYLVNVYCIIYLRVANFSFISTMYLWLCKRIQFNIFYFKILLIKLLFYTSRACEVNVQKLRSLNFNFECTIMLTAPGNIYE